MILTIMIIIRTLIIDITVSMLIIDISGMNFMHGCRNWRQQYVRTCYDGSNINVAMLVDNIGASYVAPWTKLMLLMYVDERVMICRSMLRECSAP